MIALRGFADAGDLFGHLRFAPCRSVFIQMIGVLHNVSLFFTKLGKIIHTRYLRPANIFPVSCKKRA